MSQPNILLLFSDEHSFRFMGHVPEDEGGEPIETRNLLGDDDRAPEEVRELLRLANTSIDFDEAERERTQRDGELSRRYAQDVERSTGNLYFMPSGAVITADAMLYRPEVVAAEPEDVFGANWREQNRTE